MRRETSYFPVLMSSQYSYCQSPLPLRFSENQNWHSISHPYKCTLFSNLLYHHGDLLRTLSTRVSVSQQLQICLGNYKAPVRHLLLGVKCKLQQINDFNSFESSLKCFLRFLVHDKFASVFLNEIIVKTLVLCTGSVNRLSCSPPICSEQYNKF